MFPIGNQRQRERTIRHEKEKQTKSLDVYGSAFDKLVSSGKTFIRQERLKPFIKQLPKILLISAFLFFTFYINYILFFPSLHSFKDRLSILPKDQTIINNNVYNEYYNYWWNNDINEHDLNKIPFIGLHIINPLRLNYFSGIIENYRRRNEGHDIEIVDLGCGGGILTESLYNKFKTTDHKIIFRGFDISYKSVEQARKHAKLNNITTIDDYLKYEVGSVYDISSFLPNESVDIVILSDVMEHLLDLRLAMKEIRRILKPNGLFLFDTINRTFKSYFGVIYLFENIFGIIPRHTHDWKLFIKPKETIDLLKDFNFTIPVNALEEEWKGINIKLNSFSLWKDIFTMVFENIYNSIIYWMCFIGKTLIHFTCPLVEKHFTPLTIFSNHVKMYDNDLSVTYIGYAIKH
ncbi:hypothetical protein ABK040_007143 [Willaertia magna]